MDDLITIDEGGEPRRLGLLEQPENTLKFAWPVFGADDNTPPVIPRDKWQAVSLRSAVRGIQDQNGIGMCASAATANTVEIARDLAGLAYIPLSGGDLYRRVCGGRDEGSLPENNLIELMERGIAPVDDVPFLEWRRSVPSSNRHKFKGLEAWRCPTADHVASAVQHGFPVLIGYFHHGTNNRGVKGDDPVDADGRLSKPWGPKGGHAVCVIGVRPFGSQWDFEFENTWTAKWGKNGFAFLPESRVAEGCRVFQAWALRSVIYEAGKDSTSIPPLKESA